MAVSEFPAWEASASRDRDRVVRGRPILAPLRFAEVIPATVRPRIKSRSNSAMLPRT
jgi:hypothetical protein